MTMRAAVASFLTSCALCEPKLYIEKTKLTNDNQPRLPAVSARGTCLRACLTLAQPRDDVKTAPPQSPRRPAVSATGTCLQACLPLAQPREDVKTAIPPRSSSLPAAIAHFVAIALMEIR